MNICRRNSIVFVFFVSFNKNRASGEHTHHCLGLICRVKFKITNCNSSAKTKADLIEFLRFLVKIYCFLGEVIIIFLFVIVLWWFILVFDHHLDTIFCASKNLLIGHIFFYVWIYSRTYVLSQKNYWFKRDIIFVNVYCFNCTILLSSYRCPFDRILTIEKVKKKNIAKYTYLLLYRKNIEVNRNWERERSKWRWQNHKPIETTHEKEEDTIPKIANA